MAAETTNIDSTTLDLWKKSVINQVFMRVPLVARLIAQKRVFIGGKALKAPVSMDTLESVAQEYTPNQALTNQDKTILNAPSFGWKYFQVPLQYSITERLQNNGPAKIIDLLAHKVQKGQEGARLKLREMMFNASNTEASAAFESINLACDHARTYGAITTTTSANVWWNGASISGAFTDRNTGITPSISNFRIIYDCARRFSDSMPSDYLALTSDTIFRSLKEQCERHHIYTHDGSRLKKFGFNAMMIDGVEVVADPYLEVTPSTRAVNTTRNKYFYMLNIGTWELRFHPTRAFNFDGFTHQAKQVMGHDFWLGRIMSAGNLMCWEPGANVWKSNMS